MQSKPSLLAWITCDAVHIDPASGKHTILGVFSNIKARSFPVVHPYMVWFLTLTDVQPGRHQIKMLMGLAPPTSGSIELLGLRMPEQSTRIKHQIGLVPDDTLLFDHLTGAEFLEFAGRMYGLDRTLAKARGTELLELFELSGNERKLITEYSKGMRKRLAMAAALIHRPKLFLMDEPFEGVDAVGARLMKDLLLEQVKHGATIFLTSHVLEVVERLCDRVAIINDGRLVVDSTMEELRSGSVSLEDTFVRLVGAGRGGESLDWL